MFKVFSTISRGQKIFILIWAVFLLSVGIFARAKLAALEAQNLQTSIQNHLARIDPNVTESGKTEPEKTPPVGHENDIPRDVKIGIYVDRIPALSIKDSSWTGDFYIWFNWQGDDFKPGDSFQIVNGEIVGPRVKLVQKDSADNNTHYALYRITARTTKVFTTSRFPRDDHLLTISIEDTKLQSYQLRFIADGANSNVSSRVAVPGYRIRQTYSVIKPHSYKTTRGDPDLPEGYKATYSQFIYSIWIERPNWGLYFKMFLTLFAASLIPMIGFFTTPTHRLNLTIGAFFGAVATTYVTSTNVPDIGIVTLADVIDGIGILTIAIIIFQTVISQYIYEQQKREDFSDSFDYVTFVILIGLYIWLNITIPLAASLPPLK